MTSHRLRDSIEDSKPPSLAGTGLAIPLLWVILALVAIGLRLAHLGAVPLDSAEAGQALAAHLASQGVGTGRQLAVHQPVPLLFNFNVLLFVLFDGGDALARLIPALAGVGLVLTPLLLQDYLGRWGALGAGLLLTLSPTTLFFSRRLDGATPAALGVMLLVGCVARFLETWRSSLVTLGGLGLAIALTAGPGGVGLLAGLVLALAGGLWVWWDQTAWLWPMVHVPLKRGLAVAGVAVLALGTGMGLNPAGLSAAAEQFLVWLARFGIAAGSSLPSPFIPLLAYEPLILLAGVAGLVLAMRRRHAMGLLWTFWAAVGIVQLVLMPGREPADLLWVLLPLSGLGGLAVEELVQSIRAHGRWVNEGLYLPISLVLWVHGGLALARYVRTSDPADLTLAGLTVVLQILLAAAFGFAVSTPEPDEEPAKAARRGMAAALRGGALSLGLVLLLVTLSTGWGLSHLRSTDPRELLVPEAISTEVRTLVEVAERTSRVNLGGGARLPITFLGDVEPVLAWELRRFNQQALAIESGFPALGELEDRPLLVVASAQVDPPSGYFGETFPLRRTWQSGWEGYRAVRWWLYRETSVPPSVEEIVLWVREDLATAAPIVSNDE